LPCGFCPYVTQFGKVNVPIQRSFFQFFFVTCRCNDVREDLF
jgi:hypothetical protein